MAPKLNSDSAKHNGSKGGSHGKESPSNAAMPNPYAPSVPIPVYRELAAELQATKAMLESLNAQNQALVRQNALLKKEVQTIIHSAIHLQSLMGPVASAQPQAFIPQNGSTPAIAPTPAAPTPAPRPAKPSEPVQPVQPMVENLGSEPTLPGPVKSVPPTSETVPLIFNNLAPIANGERLFTEQQESSRPSNSPTRQMSGLFLLLIVLAIMVSAFTAGFLVMRPILLKNAK